MGILNADGTVNEPILTSFLDRCNAILKKVVVPYGRLAVSFKVDKPEDFSREVSSKYSKDMLDVSKLPVQKKSVFDGALKVTFPSVAYRLDSIPGAWDEFIGRAFVPAGYNHFFGIDKLDSVIKFKTQLSMKVSSILDNDEVIKSFNLSIGADIEVVRDEANYGKQGMTVFLVLTLMLVEM